MSYYPHNQPISVNMPQGDSSPGGATADCDESLDMPRNSSNSNTLTVGVTTVATDSMKGGSSPVEGHHSQELAQQQAYEQLAYQQQQQAQMQQQHGYNGPPVIVPPMPATPDRAMVRPRPSGDGSVHGSLHGSAHGHQAVPRRSTGSGRSAGIAV